MDEVIPNKLELDWNIDGEKLKTWSTYCSEQKKSKGRRRNATRDILHSSDVTNLLRGSQLGRRLASKSTVQPYESSDDEDDSEDDFIYNDSDCEYEVTTFQVTMNQMMTWKWNCKT